MKNAITSRKCVNLILCDLSTCAALSWCTFKLGWFFIDRRKHQTQESNMSMNQNYISSDRSFSVSWMAPHGIPTNVVTDNRVLITIALSATIRTIIDVKWFMNIVYNPQIKKDVRKYSWTILPGLTDCRIKPKCLKFLYNISNICTHQTIV